MDHAGRIAELYTDRGSHFCRTPTAGGPPDDAYDTQVARTLKGLDRRDLGSRRIVRKVAADPTTDLEDTARQCTSHACAFSREAALLDRLIERFIELRLPPYRRAIHCVKTLTAL